MNREQISLVPYTSVQFYDVAFSITGALRSLNFIERQEKGEYWLSLVEFDELTEKAFDSLGNAVNAEDTFSVTLQKACQIYANTWLPLPFFKRNNTRSEGCYVGPLNWARLYISKNPDFSEETSDILPYTATFAFDTELDDQTSEARYFAPSPQDVISGETFIIPDSINAISGFSELDWVSAWLDEVYFAARVKQAAPRVFTRDMIERQTEYWALYITLLAALKKSGVIPNVSFVDILSANQNAKPIDVDFAFDMGNSRSCGMVVEISGSGNIDLNNSYPIELRSLSEPMLLHKKPFPSRLEFSRPDFGSSQFSRRSGRMDAFSWPSPARVGWEAETLSYFSRGTEGDTGMSSPKRYLWSTDIEPQEWRFNNGQQNEYQSEEPVTNSAFFEEFSDDGEIITENSQTSPAATANFSRSSMMTFFLIEVLLQVFTQINAPGRRANLQHAGSMRRLRRVIMTMPTAMTKPERDILEARVQAAIDYVWGRLGEHASKPPETLLQWDESTATQAVFLYNEVVQNFLGNTESFFRASYRRPITSNSDVLGQHLRIASLDIGGGTSDLIITSYQLGAPGQTHQVGKVQSYGLFPTQEFREGFNTAGDDILYQVIQHHVLPALARLLRSKGVTEYERVVLELLGENRGGQNQIDRTLRKQFGAQVLVPIGLHILSIHEQFGLFSTNDTFLVAWDDVFDEYNAPTERVVEYLSQQVNRAGVREFDLTELTVNVKHDVLNNTIQRIMEPTLSCLSEVIFKYDCDFLLLAGRPSRLPAVQDLLRSRWAVSPDRMVCMDDYKVGAWYPYRELNGRLGDPKTCASVGAMLCAFSETSLLNFHLQSHVLKMQSTARFIGVAIKGRMTNSQVLFSDVNLDHRATLPEVEMEFTSPITLGFRQLAVERWPATMLYRIELKDDTKASALPFKVRINKIPEDELEGIARKRRFKIFEITEVEPVNPDDVRVAINKTAVQLKLQTLENENGHWLDSGIFAIPDVISDLLHKER